MAVRTRRRGSRETDDIVGGTRGGGARDVGSRRSPRDAGDAHDADEGRGAHGKRRGPARGWPDGKRRASLPEEKVEGVDVCELKDDTVLDLLDDKLVDASRLEDMEKQATGRHGREEGECGNGGGKRQTPCEDGLYIHKRMSVVRSNFAPGSSAKKKPEMGGDGHHEGVGSDSKREAAGQAAPGHGSKQESPDDVLVPVASMPTNEARRAQDADVDAKSKGTRRGRTHRTRSRVEGVHGLSGCLKYPGESPEMAGDRLRGRATAVTIDNLPDACLIEVFKHCVDQDKRSSVVARNNPCLSTLPFVCSRWKRLLASPSDVWETLVVDHSLRLDPCVMRPWMEKRAPSIRHVHFTDDRRAGMLTGATASTPAWKTLLTSLDACSTSLWERITISDAGSQDIGYFFFPVTLSLEGIHRFAGLKSLSVSGVRTLSNRFLDDIVRLPNLETLSLSYDGLMKAEDGPAFEGCEGGTMAVQLFQLTRLRSLRIRCKTIKRVPEDGLNRLEKLEELRLEDFACKQTFPSLHGLQSLRILGLTGSSGFFGKEGVTLRDASGITGGEVFGTGAMPLVTISSTERMFALFKSLPKLEELAIDACGIREIPMAGGLQASASLKKLCMDHNPDMVFKKGLSLFQGLEHLSMRRCNMPCVSSAVTSLANLKYLDVSCNGMVECHNLGKLKKLETLVASHNPFPCIPRDVVGMSSLRELDLSGCLYLEFNASLSNLMDAWPRMTRLDLRKGSTAGNAAGTTYQASSTAWLQKLAVAWRSPGQGNCRRACDLAFE